MGSAVGLPAAALAAVLGTLGFGLGQEIDTAVAPLADKTGKNATVYDGDKDTCSSNGDRGSGSKEAEPSTNLILQILHSLDDTIAPISSYLISSDREIGNVKELLARNLKLTEEVLAGVIKDRVQLAFHLKRFETQVHLQASQIGEQAQTLRLLLIGVSVNALLTMLLIACVVFLGLKLLAR